MLLRLQHPIRRQSDQMRSLIHLKSQPVDLVKHYISLGIFPTVVLGLFGILDSAKLLLLRQ